MKISTVNSDPLIRYYKGVYDGQMAAEDVIE